MLPARVVCPGFCTSALANGAVLRMPSPSPFSRSLRPGSKPLRPGHFVLHVLWGWQLDLCIWASACTVLLYVTSGGLRASIYTEVLQFFMTVAGILPLSIMLLRQFGGLSRMLVQLPGYHLRHVWKPVLQPASSTYGEGLASILVGLTTRQFRLPAPRTFSSSQRR